MTFPETSTEPHEYVSPLPHIDGLPESHPARVLWEICTHYGDTPGADRLNEYHSAIRRRMSWLKEELPEAVAGAQKGLHQIIKQEVEDPWQLAWHHFLVDQAAAGYKTSMV